MNYLDQAKINRYLDLQNTIKQAEKELSALKYEFIAANGGETDQYIVLIKEQQREGVASKDVFAQKMGPDFLNKYGLLSVSEFKSVVIAPKKAG